MSLPERSVKRPIGTLTVAIAVVVVGLVAASRLAVDLLPSVDAPRLSITTFYEGVAPEEIETLITRPIEQAVSTVEGVTELNASSSEGLSRVQLRFKWGYNLDTATDDVREMLDRIRGRLPEGADTPIIYKFDLAQAPVASLGLSGTGGDPRRLRYLADEVLSRRLERVPGVAQASVRGGRVREIEVRLTAARLAALGVDAAEVSEALLRENRNLSAGDMLSSGREVVIRTVGEFASLEDVAEVVVTTREGRPIRVKDLGEVVDGYQDLRSEQWVDGPPGITMRISKQSGTNTVEVMENVRQEVEAINRDYEGRLKLTVLFDGAEFIKAAVTNVQGSALYGAGLAVLVLLFFLRNVRATLVVATAIPISMLATFGLMYATEVSLNVISLGGLALGVGMLVDGAIVILENAYRKREEGLAPKDAAIKGAGEVASAVVAGALTTLAVFVPVVFIGDFAGVFFREMAMVVSFALAASLVVALTVVPSLTSILIGRERPQRGLVKTVAGWAQGGMDGLGRAYARVLELGLRHRVLTVGLAVGLLAAALATVPLLGVELMPETDEGEIDVDVELPVGTPLETTMVVMKELERRAVAAIPKDELLHITTGAGPEAAWRPGTSNEGEMEITLVPVSERDRSIDEVMADVRAAVEGMPGADIRMRKGSANLLFRIMRGGDERVTVEVRGHDIDTADRLAERVRKAIDDVPGITDTYIDREPGKLEQTVHLDRARLSELGLTGARVADAVEHYVLGHVSTRFRDQGAEYDIRVRLREEDRRNVEQLSTLPIPLPTGGTVPLGAVAKLEEGTSPSSISRLDQERVVEVRAGTGDRPLGEIVADVRQALGGVEVPEGFELTLSGEIEEQAETFSGLLVGVLLALFLVYAVMVIQFESIKQPLIIMAAVPFASIGAIGALLLTGTTFNMNSFLGLIVLVGIVVNNAIILVDYTNVLRHEEGLGVLDALRRCGRTRLRPVLMTTATTVLGMSPLALGIGEGSEIQAPLARVVVGGLIVSTLVTLVVIPALYALVEGKRVKKEAEEALPATRPPEAIRSA